MSTMSLSADRSSMHAFRTPRVARSIHRTTQASNPVTNHHVLQAADATMRFTLALLPFSALAWIFIAH